MFHRILLAGIVAGVIAGVALTVLQWGAVTPLIIEAEHYETGGGGEGAPEGDTVPLAPGAHEHEGGGHAHGEAWAPEDGIERGVWTALSNVATAIGLALLLVALFAWRGGATWRQGLLWGAAGFVVFFANPAIGLRPELPGDFAAALLDRQLWWLFTVACSGAGVGLLLLAPARAAKVGGALLLALPHLAGAPRPEVAGGLAPRALGEHFFVATALTNAVFWLLLGLAASLAFGRLAARR